MNKFYLSPSTWIHESYLPPWLTQFPWKTIPRDSIPFHIKQPHNHPLKISWYNMHALISLPFSMQSKNLFSTLSPHFSSHESSICLHLIEHHFKINKQNCITLLRLNFNLQVQSRELYGLRRSPNLEPLHTQICRY